MSPSSTSRSSASNIARQAKNSPILSMLARTGYAVNGILHILIGGIAIGVASGVGAGSGGEADQSGALGALASAPGGVFVLWVVFVGLAALGIWQLLSAALVREPDATKRAAHVAGELGKAVAYLAIAVTAFTFARGGSSNSASSTSSFSATLLATPGGVFLLVVLGLGVLAIGVVFVVRGVRQSFAKRIRVPGGTAGKAVIALGVVGYVAKGIAVGVVGILFIVAAATTNASQATGLDGALKALLGLPFGGVILVVVGLGVIAYGLYCFARARLARL
ncbi:DUF1206 domain-containing protein [Frigoribacterium sp. UYMn621]|jgi:hypothetical protein|uniref:DUF1206 domain-containing protein n=1 Tax=Frigoribacterium sp. UYMn621 TaxID=3156343 RepID=UPI0033917CBA